MLPEQFNFETEKLLPKQVVTLLDALMYLRSIDITEHDQA
jgi:hypothetical protein